MSRTIEAGSDLHACWVCGLVFDGFSNADRHERACRNQAASELVLDALPQEPLP